MIKRKRIKSSKEKNGKVQTQLHKTQIKKGDLNLSNKTYMGKGRVGGGRIILSLSEFYTIPFILFLCIFNPPPQKKTIVFKKQTINNGWKRYILVILGDHNRLEPKELPSKLQNT